MTENKEIPMCSYLNAHNNLGKKSHQRILAILAEETPKGGILLRDVPAKLDEKFNKKHCSVETVEEIVSDLEVLYLTLYQEETEGDEGSRRYGCSEFGLQKHRHTVRHNPSLLQKSTTPDGPVSTRW